VERKHFRSLQPQSGHPHHPRQPGDASRALFPGGFRRAGRRSDRIGDVYESVDDAESGRKMLPDRLHAVPLSGMVPGCDVRDAALASDVHGLLGDLAGQVAVGPGAHGLFDESLSSPGAPREAPHDPGRIAEHLRYAAEALLDPTRQFGQGHGRRRTPGGKLLLAEPGLGLHTQALAQPRVVAEFAMGIERKMIGEQAHVVAQQQLDPAFAHADDACILAPPKVAVMDENGVRFGRHGGLQQVERRRDPGDEPAHLAPAFDLQAVGAIVAKAGDVQKPVGIIGEFGKVGMHRLWLIFAQTATVCLAVLFVISTLRPDLLPGGVRSHAPEVVAIREPAPDGAGATRAVSYSDAAGQAMPAVVNIYTAKEVKMAQHPLMDDPTFRKYFGETLGQSVRRTSSLGSGVIVSASGYILTNHHVIEAADEIEVALADGRKLAATLVGTDPETDLAVLKTTEKALPAIVFGEPDRLRVGDVVMAIGNPFGVGQTVTLGIVSALGRSHLGINTFENFIQTDAAINPGNSGGALIDTNGHLVGVNTAIYAQRGGTGGSLGIGFAIPVSVVRQVMESIIETGSVTRGWIGVEAHDIARESADAARQVPASGAVIAGVLPSGPAEAGGVKAGDLLVAVGDKPVADSTSMLNLVAALPPGRPATLTVMRNQAEVRLTVTVGRRPAVRRE
jgi:serine protease DegQ